MNLLWLILLVAPVFVVMAVLRNQRRLAADRASTIEVHADATGVSRVLRDGRREAIHWPEVTEVDVFTARVGPHKRAGGAVVLFGDETRGCVVPLDQLATSSLLDHLWRLPGFELAPLLAVLNADPRSSDVASKPTLLPTRAPSRTTVLWRRATSDDEVGGGAIGDPLATDAGQLDRDDGGS